MHFSTTVLGAFAVFLLLLSVVFDFVFFLFSVSVFVFVALVPVSVFDFPSLRRPPAAYVQQIFTCHSFFSMYPHTHTHTCRPTHRLFVWNCIRLVLKVALYMHILCAWPKPIGCLLQFCAAYFFSAISPRPPYTSSPSSLAGLELKPLAGPRDCRPLRLWLLEYFGATTFDRPTMMRKPFGVIEIVVRTLGEFIRFRFV